ncbi:F0F1 ATP synthase subunit delta [Helicobacter sp. 11S03491-1]|uniref:F0F1 ATP synthase subunit delta n=1 Tax=Helicobacter sp. 11S03491-1 TaxID=1476196 RepID=UPI000BA4F896|nr:F0F1 ATP synthase subunit delta [Helicobacter sp. 11S03491-1]PAF41857.1 hypothetical protein BKH45_05990 [Helicobacter sp. 11S03491-1]
MIKIIAKKYAKAIIEDMSTSELEIFLKNLKKVAQAFFIQKFSDIIYSPYISNSDKENFVLGFFEDKNNKMVNFMRLLVFHHRLDIIPFVCEVLQAYINQKNKTYTGLLYLDKEVDSGILKQIRDNLSLSLKVDLQIQQIITQIQGIKLIIDELGIEISFLKENFFTQLKLHVLKAI